MQELYEVTLRNKSLKNTWTMQWTTTSFNNAEQLTLSMLQKQNMLPHEEIIAITKDYTDEVPLETVSDSLPKES